MTDKVVRELFRSRLKEWMIVNGVPKHELARRLEVTWNTLNSWTIGRSMPSFLRIRDLAIVTGESVDWWMGLDKEERCER